MCLEAEGQLWVSSFGHQHFLWKQVSHWPATHQVSFIGWQWTPWIQMPLPSQCRNSKSTAPCLAFSFHAWGCADSSTYACKASTLLTEPFPHPYSPFPFSWGTMMAFPILCHVPCPSHCWWHSLTITLTPFCRFCPAQLQNSQNLLFQSTEHIKAILIFL